jgi:hypothetical protein
MKRQLLQIGILSAGLLFASHALADWSDLTYERELRALHTNTTLKGQAANGDGFHGHFYEGGFGTMIVNGAKMRTPWHFNGNNEMCIEWQEGAECYRYQKSNAFKNEYRAIRVRDGLVMPVLIEHRVPEY